MWKLAFLITLITGLFFLVGFLIACFEKSRKGLIEFSVGLSFSMMMLILSLDLVPEALELLDGHNKILMYVFIVIGIIMLKLLDLLVPHHNHDAEIKTHERHLSHIGIISSLALIVHNVIEGVGIYNIANQDIKSGLLLAIGVGLHNIPFGMSITAELNHKNNKRKVILYMFLLSFSTLLGAIIMMIVGNISDFVLGSLISLTIGMIIYIVLFELFGELMNTKNKKYSFWGLVAGILFMAVIMMLE